MEIYHPQDDELIREMRRVRRVAKGKRLLWGLLIALTLTALTGWLVFNRFFALAVCKGPGMSTALPEGSVVLVRRGSGADIQRGDIILYEDETGWQLKRAVALPGDRVVINPYGDLRVNSSDITADSFAGRTADTGITARRLAVPENEVFVQGDQLSLSVDSRYRDYGTVPTENVTGKAAWILWPLYRFGAPAAALTEGGGGE